MIRFVTDSTCEAPDELLAHPIVSVVPLYVLFGQETLRDNVDISRDQFWQRLPTSDPLPSTSQATPGDFLEIFRRFADAGDEIIAMVISSKLSGTYDSAIQAKAELPGPPIDIVDSLSTSVGLGLMLQQALEMANAGRSRQEIVATLNQMRSQVHVMFTVETLEYLARGGRIGKAQAFLGTRLKLKPVLGIVGGEVVPVARARGKRKALQEMLEHLGHQVTARGPQIRLGVTHADAPQEATEVAEMLSKQFASPHVLLGSLGPALGVHVGPGTIGAAAYAAI